MQVARIVGNVVATKKDERLKGAKLLIAQVLKIEDLSETNNFVISIDTVEAGVGDLVLLVSGSSARQTDKTNGKPVDSAVIGIIDKINIYK